MGTPRGASEDARLDTKIQALPPHGNESNTEHDSAKKSHHELNLNSVSTDKKNHIVVEKPKIIITATGLPPMQLTNVSGISEISSAAMNVSPQGDTNRAADAFKSLLNAVASFVDKTGSATPELQQLIAPSPFLVAAAGESSKQSSLFEAQPSGATGKLPNKFLFSPLASVNIPIDAASLPDVSAIQTTTFMAPVFAASSLGLDHKDLNSKKPEIKPGLRPASILLTDALIGQPQNIAADNQALSITGSPALSPDLSINTRDTSLKKVEPIYMPSAALLADAASAALPKVAVDMHEAPLSPTVAPIQVADTLSRSATGTGERAIVTELLPQVALPQVSARSAATFASTNRITVAEVKDLSVKRQEAKFTPASILLADATSSAAPQVATEAHDALIISPAPVPIAAILSQTAAATTDKINIADPVHQVILPQVSAREASVFASTAQDAGAELKDANFKKPETIYAPSSILIADAAPPTMPKVVSEVRDALGAKIPAVQVAALLSQSAISTGDKLNVADPTPQLALPLVSARTISTFASTTPDLVADLKDANFKKTEPNFTPAPILVADAAPIVLPKVAADGRDPVPVAPPTVQVAALLSQSANGTVDRTNVADPVAQVVLPSVSARKVSNFASTTPDLVADFKDVSVKKTDPNFTPAPILVADAAPIVLPKVAADGREPLPVAPPTVQVAAALSQSANGTVDRTNVADPVAQVVLPSVSARTVSNFASTTPALVADLKDTNFKKTETNFTPAPILVADASPIVLPKVAADGREPLPVAPPTVQVAAVLSQSANGTVDRTNVADQIPQVLLPSVSARTVSNFASTTPDLVADFKDANFKKTEPNFTPAAILVADAAPIVIPKVAADGREPVPVSPPTVQVPAVLSQSANGTVDRTNVADPVAQVVLPSVSARTVSNFASTTPGLVADLKDANFKKTDTNFTPAPILVADASPMVLPKVAADGREPLPVAPPTVQVAAVLSQSANGTVDRTNVADPVAQVLLPSVSARTVSNFASTTPDLVADLKDANFKKTDTNFTPAPILVADASPMVLPKVAADGREPVPVATPTVQVAAVLSQSANGTVDRTNVADPVAQVVLPSVSARTVSNFASTTPDLVADLKDANFKKTDTNFTPAPILVADASPMVLPKVAADGREPLPVAPPTVQVAAVLSQSANGTVDRTNVADPVAQAVLPSVSARTVSNFASTTPDLVADLKDANFKKTDTNFTPAPILVADASPMVLPKVAADGREPLPVAPPTVQVAAVLSQSANGTVDRTNVAAPVAQAVLPSVSARTVSNFASTTPDLVADLKDANFKKTDTNFTPAPILVADASPMVLPKVAADGREPLPVAPPTVQVAAILSQSANGTVGKNNVADQTPQVALPQGSARIASTFASTIQDNAPPIAPIVTPPAPAAILVADAAKPTVSASDQLNQNKNLSNSVDTSQFSGRYVGTGTTTALAEQSAQPVIPARPFSSGLARDAVEPNALLTADAGNNGKQFFALPGSAGQVKSVISDGPISGTTGPLAKLIDTTSGASAAESFRQLISRQLQGEPTVAALAADALKLVIARQLGTDLSAELTAIKPLISPADKAATPNQILVGANQILVNGGSIENRLSDPRLGTEFGPNSARSPLTISGPLDSLNPTTTTKSTIFTASLETTITGGLISTGIKTGTAADAHIAQSINIMVGIGPGVTIGADGKPITTTDGKSSLTDSRVPSSLIPLPSEITSTIKSGDSTTATMLTGKEVKLSDLTDIAGTKKGESTKVGDTTSGTGEPSARVTVKLGDKKDSKEEDEESIKNAGTMAGAGGFGGGATNPTNDPNSAQTSSNTVTSTVIDPDQKMTLPNLEIVDGRVLIAGQKNEDSDNVNSGTGNNASTRGETETGIESDRPHSRKDDVSDVKSNHPSKNPTDDSPVSEIDRLFGITKPQPSDEELAWQAGQRQTELLSFERRRPYRIKRGESLADIARRELGNVAYVQLLIELNIDTLTFDRNGQIILTPGRDIYLPSRADMLRFLAYQEQENKLLMAFADGKNIDTSHQVVYACRLGDTLASVAKRHPAIRDARLWKLIAELNNLGTQKDKSGAPVARLQRGQYLLLPTVEQKNDYLHELAFGTKSKDLSSDFVRHIADDKVPEPKPKTTLGDKAITAEPDTSFKSRLISQSDLGDTGDSLVLRLELRIDGNFVPVVEYSIGFGSATLRVHTKNGDSKVTNIDLPNRSARELAESDLAANSNMYCQNFENNVLPL